MPSRVRQARLRAGLSIEGVSAKLAEAGHPLTRAALSKYELGKSVPRQSTLVLLARIFGVPTSYFLGERSVQIEWLAFRKHARLSRSRQEQLQAQIEGLVESQVLLEETLEPSRRPNFPTARRSTGPRRQRARQRPSAGTGGSARRQSSPWCRRWRTTVASWFPRTTRRPTSMGSLAGPTGCTRSL